MVLVEYLKKTSVISITNSLCFMSALQGFDNLRSQSVAPPQWTMRNIDDRLLPRKFAVWY